MGDAAKGAGPPRIRPLAAPDRAGWDALWRGYLAFSETDLPPVQYDLHLARLTDPGQAGTTGLVAEAEGRLAGLAHCIWHVHGWHAEPVCYLQDLHTDPGCRGRGIGAALIRAVHAEADARGAPLVYGTTEASNHPARRLYARVGRKTPVIRYVRP